LVSTHFCAPAHAGCQPAIQPTASRRYFDC
jgi:hypothetical protein